jgi:hypothetical protein
MIHESYTEYLKEIIDLVPSDVDKPFIEILKETLLPIVIDRWTEYITGENETYYLSEEDLESAWKKASMTMTENSLRNLSELGLIKMGINEDGEILYSATEEGLEHIKNLK